MPDTGNAREAVWVVGVGNTLARDEGVGPAAVERLKAEPLPARVALLDAGTDLLAAMMEFADAGHVILIDAMRAGGAPGTIYRLTLEELEGRAKVGASDLSAHGLGVVEAVGLARAAGMRVPPTVVLGVEPGEVAFGEGLSPAVEAAMQRLVAAVREEIARASYGEAGRTSPVCEESAMPDIVEIPAIWLQGSACTGCAVSLLNSFTPGASSLVLNELVPGKHISLRFIVTVMAGQGRQVVDVLKDTAARDKGGYVLVVEGSLPVGDPLFGTMGEENGREVPIAEHAVNLARNALAVVAMGTCAAFGGIPAGAPNPTEALSARDLLAREGVSVPLINIPGCPPHPDWLVGSLAAVMLYGLGAVAATLDELARPAMFYGKCIHETCPRRADFDAGRFAKKFGDTGCLYELGCKGPVTFADCPTRLWNSGTNWCIGAGSPCHGCVEPDFPDRLSPLYRKIDEERLARLRLLGAETATGEDV